MPGSPLENTSLVAGQPHTKDPMQANITYEIIAFMAARGVS